MKKRSILAGFLAGTLLLSVMLTACGPSDPAANIERTEKLVETDPYVAGGPKAYKFDPPITISAVRYIGPNVKFDDKVGDDAGNNIWTRAYEEFCGVKTKWDLITNDSGNFDTQINAAITTNNVPDLLPVYTTLFFRLANSKKLYDLSAVYEKYADEDVKEHFEERSGGIAKLSCTIDDQLVGLAAPPEPAADFLWVRKDWLDEYSLEMPKNADETINIMETFAQFDAGHTGKTYGMSLDKNLSGLNGFANMFGAYYGIWIEKEDGTLIRSETDETAWKPVLYKLREMFENEVIDQEFQNKANTDINNDYATGKLGLVFANVSAPDGAINNAVEADKNAEWAHGLVYDKDGKPALMQYETRVTSFCGMNVNTKYPEALILITNIWNDLITGPGKEYQKYHDFIATDGTRMDSFFYPPFGGLGGEPNYNYNSQQKVAKALETGDTSGLDGQQLGYYDRSKPWLDDKTPTGWRMFGIFGIGGSTETGQEINENGYLMPNCGWGQETDTWANETGPILASEASAYFARMIGDVGLSVDDLWDAWIQSWTQNKGDVCTQEINEWWQATGKEGYKAMTDF